VTQVTSGSAASTPLAVDLSDDRVFRHGFPHDYFGWLRDHHPVFWHEPTDRTPDGEGFWVVSRWADVRAVQRDGATFSSDRGGVRERGGTALKDERTAGMMLNQTDDPQHHRLRTIVNRGFTPPAVAALEAQVRARINDLLDRMDGGARDGAVEFVHGFARELPAEVICMVLGIRQEDRPQLLDTLDAGIEADSPSILSADAMREIRTYANRLIAEKRAEPDDAIMSVIINAHHDDGSQLNDQELVAFFALLFPAGAETTKNSLTGAVKAFIDRPDEYDRLHADPSLLPAAVEEVVRWTTPSIYKRRTAGRDTELAGVPIRTGDKVTIWEMSANRDERTFADPFRFDVGRSPNPHVGFGWGVHFCLGASLARMEIRLTLEALLERYSAFASAGPAEWVPNNRLFGLKTLPVRALAR
jgi:cytochrome P450